MRTLIPPIVYRLLRCAPKDVEVLSHLIELLNGTIDPKFASDTPVLDYLVGFSEMWETPTPSIPELKARYAEATMSSWAPYVDVFKYCAFSKEKSPVYNQLKLGDCKSNGIFYDRDEYRNKAAKIPNQASVLLMSSKMDPFAPHKYAKYLLDALDGDKKELITFKYIVNGNLVDSGTEDELCGLTVLASFVQGDGNLAKLNKTCVEEDMTASLNWTVLIDAQHLYLSTDNAYDGVYDASLSASISDILNSAK